YRSGVLCIDAVEISTTGGHYIALDLPPAPYPLGGEARDVVEDVKRLGGFGIVAHPNSPKPALSWQAWDAPFDAFEWMNPDTSWRIRLQSPSLRQRLSLVHALLTYPFRSPESIAHLLAGAAIDADRWEAITKTHRVVALGGADAHENLAFGNTEPGDSQLALPFPGYETSFHTLSIHVRPDRPISGNAVQDSAAVIGAIRRGHLYTAIDGLASPPSFQFTAANDRETVGEGDAIDGTPVTLRVMSNSPPSFSTAIWEGNRVVAAASGQSDFTHMLERPGAYRAEISAPSPDGPIPWIVSNPIYVGVSYRGEPRRFERPSELVRALFDGRTSSGWWTEADPGSAAALDVSPTTSGEALRLRYRLAGASATNQYVTMAVNSPTDAAFDRVTFTARSDRPIRIAVQLRVPGQGGDRWQQSVYVDQSERGHSIDVNEMIPIGETRTPRPDSTAVRDIMFVIDTTHAVAGWSGSLWIRNVSVQKIS
ncbi:MAG: hypothetical protein C5B57_05945, partial [Blastocatellia bacterium]